MEHLFKTSIESVSIRSLESVRSGWVRFISIERLNEHVFKVRTILLEPLAFSFICRHDDNCLHLGQSGSDLVIGLSILIVVKVLGKNASSVHKFNVRDSISSHD